MAFNKPRASIIIPAYNVEKYIEETINSVLEQNFTNLELLIIDDCSKDDTLKIIKNYSNKDKRIKIFKNKKNRGKMVSVNKLFKKVRGKYLVLLDADDLFYPERLRKQVEFLDKHPKIDMVYGNFKISENGKEKFRKALDSKENFLVKMKKESERNRKFDAVCRILDPKDYIPASSVMFRKEIIDKGIKMDENLRNSEDYDFWFQIIGKGYKIKKMEIITYKYRIHSQQKSKNKEKAQIATKYILNKLRKGEYFKG